MIAAPLFDCSLPADRLDLLSPLFAAGQLATGPAVGKLEQEFDARFDNRCAVGVGDMTHALALALRVSGIGAGDEVLSLAFNCMSSTSAIPLAGARAVWVDVDPGSATMDLDHARRQVTARTKAAMIYNVSGYPPNLRAIRQFCDDHNLVMIEDANNAFGASFDGREVGTYGDFAVFSFYANRQINGIDGGLLLCRSASDAARARKLRRFGIDTARFRDPYGEIDASLDVAEIGASALLNNVNATLALASMVDADARVARSRANAALLTRAGASSMVEPIRPLDGSTPAYWTWLVRVANRDHVMRELKRLGVLCSKLHHPNHHYTGFAASPTQLPGTQHLQDTLLAIPCGWWLDEETVLAMGAAIGDIAERTA